MLEKTYEKKHVCSLSETMSSAWETTRRVGVGPGLVMWSRLAGPGFPGGGQEHCWGGKCQGFSYLHLLLLYLCSTHKNKFNDM